MGASTGIAADLFKASNLCGSWRLQRRIRDARTGETARFKGTCRFTPDTGGLCYDEEGQLTMPGGGRFTASRRYLWRFDSNRMIRVLFEDGRLFHILDPTAPETRITHLCDPDTYIGQYRLHGDGWTSRWQVSGPRKDQQITTRHRREPA